MPLTAEQYLRPDVIQQVQRLDLKARFIVEGLLSGLHDSPYHGFSAEFSEHRKYTPGDDPRAIDWQVYARTDRFYIKKHQAETNLEAYLLVDCSRSMGYATGGRMSKMDYAVCLAAALGYLMTRQQDAVGLATFDERLRTFLPPRSKRAHLTNLLSELARTKPTGRTGLAAALHEVARRVRKRGLMILLSDMLAEPDDVVEALHHLKYRGHDLIIFQVLDHSEVAFEFDGHVRFEEPESSEQITVDPRAIRSAYRAELAAFIESYRRQCLAMQADFTMIDTAMTFDKALVQFLVQRQARF